MARYKLCIVIAVNFFLQKSHGQIENLTNSPTGGQNLKQSFSNQAGKCPDENLLQNDFLKVSRLNNNGQANLHQSQPSPFIPFSLQSLQVTPNNQQNQPQILSQNITPQLKHPKPAELQVPISYQPSTIPQQLKDTSNSIFPVIPQTSVNSVNLQSLLSNKYQQIPLGSLMQQIPVQISQDIPSNSFLPTYSTVLPVTSYESSCSNINTNLNNNYAFKLNALPIPEAQAIKTYPVQYQSVLPTSNTFVPGVNTPYQSHAFSIVSNPSGSRGNIEKNLLRESDNINSFLWSLQQTPKSVNYPQYHSNSFMPYSPYYPSTPSKSSSLKSLLPLIFDLIKERREGCVCNNCCQKNKLKDNVEPLINGNYLNKAGCGLRDEMFRDNNSGEDIPRIAREHTKCKYMKEPNESIESAENPKDFEEFSDEQDD